MEKFIYSLQHPFVRKSKFQAGVTPEFDFIIVGGGPAGCALATRLSEDESFSVLLIEQGTTIEQQPELRNCVDHTLQTRVLHSSAFDARYPTVPDGRFGRKDLVINSGKVLGGSSCINWAIWTRGSKDDYDLWADLVEDASFNWENMISHFEKVENGPISIRKISPTSRNPSWSVVAQTSLAQSGFQKIEDFSKGDLLGYSQMAETIDGEGKRSTANAYLRAAAERIREAGEHGRFEVWTALRVDKIMFEEEESADRERQQRAIGVVTQYGLIRARREVILTAGAIQSAHLLLLSGVGPAAQLSQHGIPVIHDSPHVGQHLWEHPYVDLMFKLKDNKRGDTVEDFASIKTSARHIDEWAKSKRGLMSGLPYEWMAFTNLKRRIERPLGDDTSVTATDRLVLLRATSPHVEQMIFYGHGLTAAPDPLASSYIAISNVLLTPRSRGCISLSGSDPATQPRILVNQLEAEIDQEMMVAALEIAYRILRAPAWAEHLVLEETPSRQQMLETIKDRMGTLWHIGGTCSMQTKYVPGVVDSAFRVQGIRGLRIADTSVIPIPLAAHTQSIAYVLGEKAAVIIRENLKACLFDTPVKTPASRISNPIRMSSRHIVPSK